MKVVPEDLRRAMRRRLGETEFPEGEVWIVCNGRDITLISPANADICILLAVDDLTALGERMAKVEEQKT